MSKCDIHLNLDQIGVYFGSVMVICSMSIIANVVVLIFHHRNVKIQHPMAKWVSWTVIDV